MKLINVSALIPVITHRQQNIYLLVHWRLTPTISVFQLEHYDRFFSITKAGMVQWPRSHYASFALNYIPIFLLPVTTGVITLIFRYDRY
jgi:hypothetical protein